MNNNDTDETYQRCTVAQWEKKAELAMLNGDMGEAMKFAHYANMRDAETGLQQEADPDD